MAHEWQLASSFDPIPRVTEAIPGDASVWSRTVARNWSETRGAVLWEGTADLVGSFPGFAHWGSRAESVHLTLTDHFLLVDEATDYGFGLPIGWLSAAQALTGVEPISTEAGDHLRICYLDGNQVRGFTLRVRGGRFGGRSGRRANQLRTAAMSLGLASTTPATDLLLPPEHDLSLDWDDFATHESEPVVWTGRAAMPVGSGLESASCDVWLTSSSLIWGARSRAGIHRIATGSLAGLTAAETPAHEPVVYWTVSGSHQMHVDVPMIFPRPGRNDPDPAAQGSLIELLEGLGHRVGRPDNAPQPWRAPAEVPWAPEPGVPGTETDQPDRSSPAAVESRDARTGDGSGRARANRRRLLEDGLLPERVLHTLPPSTPLPWGQRVERVDADVPSTRTPVGTSDSAPEHPERLADPPEPASDRLQRWPPPVPRQSRHLVGGDAAAMLVRRPRVRATTTEEFLASERAARAADQIDVQNMVDSDPTPSSLPERGIIVRFRRPQAVVVGLTGTLQGAAETDAARSTSSFAVPKAGPVMTATAGVSVAEGIVATSSGLPRFVATEVLETTLERPTATPTIAGAAPRGGAEEAVSGEPSDGLFDAASAAVTLPEPSYPALTARTGSREMSDTAGHSHLPGMRSAMSAIDDLLNVARLALNQPDEGTARPVVGSTAPFLARAMSEIAAAVVSGALTDYAAATHRTAITRSADTTERLRSLLDLHAGGYLTRHDLESRGEALLARPIMPD